MHPSRHHRSLGALAVAVVVAASLSLVVVMSPHQSTTNPLPSRTGADLITISTFAFSPYRLVVTPGTVVEVRNRDYVDHTVTALDGQFHTGDIAHGRMATFTAPHAAGVYDYECAIHPFMRGVLVVAATNG